MLNETVSDSLVIPAGTEVSFGTLTLPHEQMQINVEGNGDDRAAGTVWRLYSITPAGAALIAETVLQSPALVSKRLVHDVRDGALVELRGFNPGSVATLAITAALVGSDPSCCGEAETLDGDARGPVGDNRIEQIRGDEDGTVDVLAETAIFGVSRADGVTSVRGGLETNSTAADQTLFTAPLAPDSSAWFDILAIGVQGNTSTVSFRMTGRYYDDAGTIVMSSNTPADGTASEFDYTGAAVLLATVAPKLQIVGTDAVLKVTPWSADPITWRVYCELRTAPRP